MAMLQFGGLLSNATVRITPRASWWTTAQHLLHASSVATNPVRPAAADNPKDKKIQNDIEKQEHKSTNKPDKSLVMSVFKKLLEDYKQDSIKKSKQNDSESSFQAINSLNNKINLAINIDELLNIVKHPNFNEKNASNIMSVLSNWASSGKIKMSDIQSDVRYRKVCRILNLDKQISDKSSFSMTRDLENLSDVQGFVQSVTAKKEIDRLNIMEIVSVLKMLATNKKRPTPLLQSLAKKLSNTGATLNIKQLGDILYSMSVLNFYDELLMQKGVTELKKVISKTENNAVIGSILTSLSLLRFKDEKILDELSLWILRHREKIRPQEIISLLLTLGNLGYTPKNFTEVFEEIVKPLKESDMCQSKEWLDIVWSLSILNRATSDQYESVLNSHFVNRVLDSSDLRLQTSKILKLLNINASAQSFMPEYKGPFISEDSEIFKVAIVRSDKMGLSNSVISALKILLPSDSIYFNINVNTQMGFVLDAEFCVDKKGTPVAVNFKSDNEKQVFRIGVLTCAYNEFCRGVNEVTGPIQFYKKVLENRGYKVLLVPYTDVNVKDKIVTRVKYINDKIKILLESDSTK